jgi:flagellar biosynthesis/type III secretory pathway chaperone
MTMGRPGLRQQLADLQQLILQEREYAKALDMENLARTAETKSRLLAVLDSEALPLEDEETRRLAATVREENRRNAYLFYMTLQWVRDLMTFYGQRTAPGTYGARGNDVRHQHGGRLLSGRI